MIATTATHQSQQVAPPPKRLKENCDSKRESSNSIENSNYIVSIDSNRRAEKQKSSSHSHRIVIPQVSTDTLKGTILGKYDGDCPFTQHCHSSSVVPREALSVPTLAPTPSNSIVSFYSNDVPLPPPPKNTPVTKPSKPPRENLIIEIDKLLQISVPLQEPQFRFEISEAAAEFNFDLLQKHNFNLESLLNHRQGPPSVTTYGSEFKTTAQLESLLHRHPRWTQLKQLLETGSKWDLEVVPESLRVKDAAAAIDRGNHKSAGANAKFLEKALSNEILKGWELVLPSNRVNDIPNLVISPMGVATHIGVQSDGSFAPKPRVTHDLSFPGKYSEQSINSRVLEDTLQPCMFGHALLRIIHRIVHLRQLFPNKTIWIRKEDAKSAYRRVHLNASTAFKTAVQLTIDGIAYILIALRLPFGGSPCPSEFCLVSDIITDVINDLMANHEWNPQEVRSEYVHKIPPPSKLPSDVPFATALPTSVPNREGANCSADVFIDDIITVGADINDNLERIKAGPCTVMHAIAHQTHSPSSVTRQDFIAEDKNDAEGAPEEVKIVLGWEINSRELKIKLPKHKFIAWNNQLQSFFTRRTAGAKDLQSILGRLETVATIIPMMGHFLNNIRHTEIRASASGKNQLLNKRTVEDFKLAAHFLIRARDGVNMNLITFRKPTLIYINDACEHGIGGFATHGRAWTWIIPPHLRGRAHINLLEFMAQLVSIWIDVIEKKIQPLDCLLGMGDNTASMGWLRRANFRELNESDKEWYAKQQTARKLATLVLNSNTVLYRQWFRGADNELADSLSRDALYLPPQSHKTFLTQTLPTQIPNSFHIAPPPKEILSFISSILLLLPVQQQRLVAPKPSELLLSNTGLISSQGLECNTSFSKFLPNSSRISSCRPSHKPYVRPPSLKEIEENWWKAQSMPPSRMWHRPSGQTTGLTPDWTAMGKSVSYSRSNLEGTAIRTVKNASRKHCL